MIGFNDLIDAGIKSLVREQYHESYKELYENIISLEDLNFSPEDIIQIIKGKLRDKLL